MKLYAIYKAFPCDEKGIKTKVIGRVEIEARTILNHEEVMEAARTKLYATVPSLRGTPITLLECGLVEVAEVA
jgi:hypothetical protein